MREADAECTLDIPVDAELTTGPGWSRGPNWREATEGNGSVALKVRPVSKFRRTA
jgi:hypothetical protein